MATKFYDTPQFVGISLVGATYATSAIGSETVGDWGWSVTNQTVLKHSISATESTAANIANALAGLIYDLVKRGVIQGTGILG